MEFVLHAAEYAVPVAEGGLAEEPHRGVPRAVVAAARPAPLADRAEPTQTRTPRPPARWATAVSGVITRSRWRHDGRGLHEVASAAAGQLDDRKPAGQGRELIQAMVGLQADQPDARQLGQWGKLGQRK